MDSATITAIAALAGAAIGGLTSFAASWVAQQAQAKTQRFVHTLTRREELYKDFIEEAAKLYADALVSDTPEVPQLVKLYAQISRMRVHSSPRVIENADKVARLIVNTYLAPNKSFRELRDMVNTDTVDALRDFSEACREEFQSFESS